MNCLQVQNNRMLLVNLASDQVKNVILDLLPLFRRQLCFLNNFSHLIKLVFFYEEKQPCPAGASCKDLFSPVIIESVALDALVWHFYLDFLFFKGSLAYSSILLGSFFISLTTVAGPIMVKPCLSPRRKPKKLFLAFLRKSCSFFKRPCSRTILFSFTRSISFLTRLALPKSSISW